jgi:hypothetical protein
VLGVGVWLALCYVSFYVALWLFPVREGTFSGKAAEAVIRDYSRFSWAQTLIYVVLCVLVFHLVPFAWRRWCRGTHGEVAR